MTRLGMTRLGMTRLDCRAASAVRDDDTCITSQGFRRLASTVQPPARDTLHGGPYWAPWLVWKTC